MSLYGPKKNTAFTLYLPFRTWGTSEWRATPTIAAGDVQVSIDGGAFANTATLPAETPASGKAMKIALSAAEMNGDAIVVRCVDQTANKEWEDTGEVIYTRAVTVDDLVRSTTPANTLDVNAAGGVEVGSFQAGVITNAAFAAGAIDATAIADNAIDAGAIAADAITAAKIANGAIDAATFAAGAVDAAALAADAAVEIAGAVWDENIVAAHGAADAAGRAIRTLDAISDRTNNANLNALLGVADSIGADVPSQATDEVWDEARSGHATAGSFGEGAASVQGNVTGSVGSVTGAVGSVAAGGITAASIATNAIDADAIAPDAVTEIQSGLATSAALTTVQTDTDDIQSRLPAALVGGRMASNAEVVGDKTGYALSAAGVQAIWDALTSALTTVGSVGKLIVDNLNATISSRATVADVPTANANADAVLDRANGIETGWTLRQAFRIILAALGGKSSGGAATGASSPVFRDATDTKDRITATVDASGNRTSVTLDGT